MSNPATLTYGHVIETKVPYELALELARAFLKDEGFGVQTQIDIAATMKEKLGVQHHPYMILGVCNPEYAHQALSHDPQIGLLLPCNIVVQAKGTRSLVSAIDARVLMQLVDPSLAPVAEEVNRRLRRVLERVAAAEV